MSRNEEHWLDDLEDYQERFVDRKIKRERKKVGTRSVASFLAAPQASHARQVKFDDPALQTLHEKGHLDELLWRHQQGKEATVYVARGPHGLMAAKIYTDMRIRSFRNDRMYREGRYIKEKRVERAIEARSNFGLSVQQSLWIDEEFHQLQALYQAEVPVPRPINRAGPVILMQFIGDETGAAPRLSEANLEPEEVQSAFRQAVHNLGLIVRAGRVHGDYSTFNLLWWEDRVWVIDFPQMVEIDQNPMAMDILRRDVEGLCRTFRHLGLKPNPTVVLPQVLRIAGETNLGEIG